MPPLLSVLVATTPRRLDNHFIRTIRELEKQINDNNAYVEIVGLYDNKHRSVGGKRNCLMHSCSGKFLSFVDDDDFVTRDYIHTIYHTLLANPEAHVVVFEQYVFINDGPPKVCKYGVELSYTDSPHLWTGLPAHTMVWRSEIAKSELFPEMSNGEDMDWVRRVAAKVDPAKQVRLDHLLYHYRYNDAVTETRA